MTTVSRRLFHLLSIPVFLLGALTADGVAILLTTGVLLTTGSAAIMWLACAALAFVLGALAGGLAVSLRYRRWRMWHVPAGLTLAAVRFPIIMPLLFTFDFDLGAHERFASLVAPSLVASIVFVLSERRRSAEDLGSGIENEPDIG